jgi:hypothetical protein
MLALAVICPCYIAVLRWLDWDEACLQAVAVVRVHLLAGNWGAIIFGVVASSCGLLGVMAAGCYSDVSALLANSRRKQKQEAGSRRSSRAGQHAMPVGAVQQMLGQGQQGAPGTASLHQH